MSINMNQEPQGTEYQGNKGDFHYVPTKWGSQIVRRSKRVYKGVYDFAVQGGAVGAVPLYDPILGKQIQLALPANFIITNVLIDCVTALAGGGASVALTSGQAAGDLLGATAVGAAPFTGTIAAGIPVSAATAIKIPAAQAAPGSLVGAVISGGALTAGKFNVHIEGFLSDLL